MSQAIWIWRDSGSMSGARRALTRTAGSNFLSVACLTAFSSSFDTMARFGAKVSTDIEYMEIFIPGILGARGDGNLTGRLWRRCLTDETIGSNRPRIGGRE